MAGIKLNKILLACGIAFLAVCFVAPGKSFAKGLSLSADKTTVNVGDSVRMTIRIDTSGEKINVLDFRVDYPTDILEGRYPSITDSVFKMATPDLSATRFSAGIWGPEGFSGSGLVAVYTLQAKRPGTATVQLSNIIARYGPEGTQVPGFTSNSITLNINGSGGVTPPPPTGGGDNPPSGGGTQSGGTTSEPNVGVISPVKQPTAQEQLQNEEEEIKSNLQVFGSAPQVIGSIGSINGEDPIKIADGSGEAVKGVSLKNPAVWSFIPTLILAAFSLLLGFKLFYTDKKRKMELQFIFDNHMSTLSALESKIDLFDSKAEGAKEKIVDEFEKAKALIASNHSATIKENDRVEKEETLVDKASA